MLRSVKVETAKRKRRLRHGRALPLELLESRQLLTVFTAFDNEVTASDYSLPKEFKSISQQSQVTTPKPFSASFAHGGGAEDGSDSFSVSQTASVNPETAGGVQTGIVTFDDIQSASSRGNAPDGNDLVGTDESTSWGMEFTAPDNGLFSLQYVLASKGIPTTINGRSFYAVSITVSTQGGPDGLPLQQTIIQQGAGADTYTMPIVAGVQYSFYYNADYGLEFGPGEAGSADTEMAGNLNWELDLYAPSVTPSLAYDTVSPGAVDLGYTIANADLPVAAPIDLYWASGTTPDTAIGGPIIEFATGTNQESINYTFPSSYFTSRPQGAKYLLAVADVANVVTPADPSKIVALPWIEQWTGTGANNLWSNPANWLDDAVPQADDPLVFPAGAQQLSNNNDLGYTFKSISVAGSYAFSGDPINVSGDFSFDGGSPELDTSATVAGDTNIDDGADLTVGTGDTLNDGLNLQNGKLSVLGNLDLNANATVTKDGSVEVEAGGDATIESGTSAFIAGDIDILGYLNLNGQMDLESGGSCNADATLNVATAGALIIQTNAQCTEGANSQTNINGTVSIASGGSLTAGVNSTTTQADGSSVSNSGSLTVASGGNWQMNGQSVMTDASGATTTVSGSLAVQHGAQVTGDAGAAWKNTSGSSLGVYGEFTNNGAWNVEANSSVTLKNGGILTVGGNATSAGVIQAQTAYSSPYNQLNINGTLNVVGKDAQLYVGASDVIGGPGALTIGAGAAFDNHGRAFMFTLSDTDSITVEPGAILDISGSFEEGANGQLTDEGTVTIESGATFNSQTACAITAGGLLTIDGSAELANGSLLDNFGNITIDPSGVVGLAGKIINEVGSTFVNHGSLNIESGGSLVSAAATTSTAVSISPSGAILSGHPVTVNATVSPSTATGTVEFFDNGTDLGGATLVGGVAVIPNVLLPVGSHSIEAVYRGDSNDQPSQGTSGVDVYGAPVSQVNSPLTTSPSGLVSGSVTASQTGPSAPGIASVAVYVAIDGGSFAAMPIATLSPTNLNFTYQATPGHHYYFRSIATDAAGNVETKTTVDAATYVAIPAPTSHVQSATPNDGSAPSNATFAVTVTGTDAYGPGIASFAVYLSVDGGTPILVQTLVAGVPNSGVYQSSFVYQGNADGLTHTYSFSSVATDTAGRVEATHAAADVTVTHTFQQAALAFTGVTIQHSSAERSFVEFVDLDFNEGGAALTNFYNALVASPSLSLQLLERAYGTTTNQTVSLNGVKLALDSAHDLIELDFGALGLGGVARGSATLASYWKAMTAADGWYGVYLDLTSSGQFSTTSPHSSFERLLGDTNGDGTVDQTDMSLVAQQQGQSGLAVTGDLNGDGGVDSTDTYLVGKSKGRSLGANPFQ